ncbi:MAG: cytochrome c [Rhodomicrobiaceae bacterium]
MSLGKGGLAAAVLLAVTAGMTSAGMAADLAAGKKKAMQCTVCHGRDGIAVNPDAPNLAGEAASYIERQLKAFKTGERKQEIMSIVAQGLTDEDIANLAAWYSAMKISVQLPDVK